MCGHNDTVTLRVPIPAGLSHTGEFHWAEKPVDRCIAPLVAALNAGGEFTANSCCGHGKGPGVIALHDGRELAVSATTQPTTPTGAERELMRGIRYVLWDDPLHSEAKALHLIAEFRAQAIAGGGTL